MGAYRKEVWTDADVRCPFYVSDTREGRSITCEGCMDDSSVTTKFRTLERKDRHMGRYCVCRFETCPIYRCTYDSKYAGGV